MKRYSKPKFWIMIIMNWNYLIAEQLFNCFQVVSLSFHCTIFVSNKKSKNILLWIISTSHICHTCHICRLTEVNCCLGRTTNCGKVEIEWPLIISCHWSVSDKPLVFWCFQSAIHLMRGFLNTCYGFNTKKTRRWLLACFFYSVTYPSSI